MKIVRNDGAILESNNKLVIEQWTKAGYKEEKKRTTRKETSGQKEVEE